MYELEDDAEVELDQDWECKCPECQRRRRPTARSSPKKRLKINAVTWKRYAHKLERQNIKEHGTSLTAASICMRAGWTHLVEILLDEDRLIVRDGWKEAMRQIANMEKGENHEKCYDGDAGS